ncbi:MAG: L,D-transpeptidase family protein [Gemmatimonadaceae bacterium]
MQIQLRFSLVVLALAAAACRNNDAATREAHLGDVAKTWSPGELTKVRETPIAELRQAIQERVADGTRPKGLDAGDWKRVVLIYEHYQNQPLWLEEDADSERGDELVTALSTVHEHGLPGDAYPLQQLRDALAPIDKNRRPTAQQLAEADVLLTSIYVALGEDLLTGQLDPNEVSPDWRIRPQTSDVDSLLAGTLRGEPLARAIELMRPQDEQYDALREQLERYRSIAASGGWPGVPEGSTLRPGDTANVERLNALRARLAVEEYIARGQIAADSTGRAVYEGELARAVATFQRRHGIVVDSILGPGTLTSLNQTAEYRTGQIMANLERYRWMPRSLGDRYVYVNVPAFHLDAYEDGRPVLSMKVIVGQQYADQATPAFSDSMTYVEFAPYWNVPENIAEEELWPKINADPGYLERNEYEIVNDRGGPRIRQLPGEKNALGRVKFIFPNDLSIYLHDTPARNLFERDVRAFSHGCIRVEKPGELAKYVLSNNPGWEEGRIEDAMHGRNRRVVLKEKIPVYIVYFTAYVRDGILWFANDLYERDSELVRIVERSALPSPRDVALLAELRKLAD